MAGRDRSEIAEGVRSFPFGNYVVFYRPRPRAVEDDVVAERERPHALGDLGAIAAGHRRLGQTPMAVSISATKVSARAGLSRAM